MGESTKGEEKRTATPPELGFVTGTRGAPEAAALQASIRVRGAGKQSGSPRRRPLSHFRDLEDSKRRRELSGLSHKRVFSRSPFLVAKVGKPGTAQRLGDNRVGNPDAVC